MTAKIFTRMKQYRMAPRSTDSSYWVEELLTSPDGEEKWVSIHDFEGIFSSPFATAKTEKKARAIVRAWERHMRRKEALEQREPIEIKP